MALMGGAYGNVPDLKACLKDANRMRCDTFVFLDDAIGCCGHSDDILRLIRDHFDVLVAGNLEQQAARGADTCGCGYASPDDEWLSCMTFTTALESLSDDNRNWLASWPARRVIDTTTGPMLLCHGSPDATSEFLYESEVDEARLRGWLSDHGPSVWPVRIPACPGSTAFPMAASR